MKGIAGWTAAVDTDQQDGEVASVEEKRKPIYFNYIKGLATTLSEQWTTQAGEFATRGLSLSF